MNVAQAIAEILKQENVEYITAYPVNPLIDAVAERDIRPVIVRQERTGLHMADAGSRLSSGKKIGVFVMQNGPGSENAFGGVAQAYSESVPILVLPVGYSRRNMGYFPNYSSSLNSRNITKHTEAITTSAALTDTMRRAFALLRNGRPGPVLIELPQDIVYGPAREPINYTPSFHTRTAPDPVAVIEVAKVLSQAENPVIYAGQGVHYAEAWDELQEFAELMSIPVTTSLEGKSAFPENHPLSLGSGGRSMPKAVHQFLGDSDVIFGIGCSFAQTAFGIRMPQGKTMIHATLDTLDLNKDITVQHALVGDAKLILRALMDELGDGKHAQAEKRRESIPGEIKAVKDAWLAEWMPKLTSADAPISPYRVIWELLHTVDVENTIITHDAGSPRDQLSPFWEPTRPLSYIGWGKTTQLGYGLGLAMGAKLAQPDRLCINVWGDAAIGFTGMDFETAVRERLPILSILMNNFSMAVEIPIMRMSTEKYGTTNISGNYADMAKAFGGYGERVADPGEIVNAINRGIEATKEGTPALIEFMTAKEFNYSTF